MQIEKEIRLQMNSQVQVKEQYLKNYIIKFYDLLSSTTTNDIVTTYIKSPNERNEQSFENLLFALTKTNPDIMQLRYIDSSGQEIIRIQRDFDLKSVFKISQNKLQNKASRYYFKEASKISKDTFWHSHLDLNVEQGKIEFPLKPTYRIARKLIVDGKFQGIIVNILCKDLLRTLTTSATFDIYLVDKQGHILKDPKHLNDWSKYLENKQSIFDTLPKRATKILQNNTFKDKYTFAHSLEKFFLNNEDLHLILLTKQSIIKELKDKILFSTSIIAFIIIIISSPLAWILSIAPTKLQAQLSKAYERMRENTQIIDKYVIMFSINTEGIFTCASKRLEHISGYTYNEIINKHFSFLKHPDTPKNLYEDIFQVLKMGQIWEGEMICLDKNKQEFWLHLIITPKFTETNEIKEYTTIATNITNEKIIEKISITDELTQIYNRRKIEDILNHELERAKRYNQVFSVIFLDIDKFKAINDNFGHSSGDDVLVQLSAILKSNLRETDFIGRWGGEEFIIVCSQTQKTGAFNLAQTLRSIVENSTFCIKSKVTISLGVAQYDTNEDISDLISRADTALYRAKDLGRNRVEMA
jgi:diguanylate cyclase (GGDEF)-like protein/PAS domain S-box-containing protein